MAIKFLNNSSVTGQLTVTNGIEMTSGNFNAGDNERIRLGNSADLQIYHDGSNSFIHDSGAGSLKTVTSGFQLLNSTQTQFMMLADGGATSWIKLYYSGSERLATTSAGISVAGAARIDNGLATGAGAALYVLGSGDAVHTSGGSIFFGAYDYGNSTYIRGYDNSAGLYFYANGALTMNVNGSGNVGIGTTSPSAKLHLEGDAIIEGVLRADNVNQGLGGAIKLKASNALTDQYVAFGTTPSGSNGSANFTEKMRITSAGNVGIGTTSPSTPLHFGKSVYGDPSSENFFRIKFNDVGGVNNDVGVGQPNASSIGWNITPSADGVFEWNAGTAGRVMNLTNAGVLTLDNYDSTNNTGTPTYLLGTDASGNVVKTNTVPGSAAGPYLPLTAGSGNGLTGLLLFTGTTDANRKIFFTNAGAYAKGSIDAASYAFQVSGSEKLTIDSSGNVGIGTTSPITKLTVETSNESLQDVLAVHNGITGTSALGKGAAIRIGSGNNGNYSTKIATIYEGNNPGYLQPALAFFTMHNTYLKDSEVERMRIASSGNVGIGTTSPGAKLEVSGSNSLSIKLSRNNTDSTYTTTLTNNYDSTLGTELKSGDYNILTHGNSTGTSLNFTNGAMTFDFRDSEKMRITDGGNVGIGTTSPGSKLQVGENTSGLTGTTSIFQEGGAEVGLYVKARVNRASILVADNDTGVYVSAEGGIGSFGRTQGVSTANINIDGTGNVGIGTISPTAPLDVYGVRAGRDWAIANRAVIRLDSNGVSEPSDILFGHTAAANETSWTGAYWSLSSRGSSDGNKFHFYRASGNPTISSEAVIMTFDPNLNVGIGTTSPDSKLEVVGVADLGASGYQIRTSQSVGNNSAIIHRKDSGGSLELRAASDDYNQLVVKSGGNVGIGTGSPAEKLHVSGKVLLNNGSSLYIDTTATQTVFANIANIPMRFQTNSANRLTIGGAGAIQFNNYNSTNNTGTPTYLLGTDASGNVVKTLSTPSPITSQAASLYDLIPNGAFTTTYSFTSVAGVYSEVMEGNDVITSSGTYSVQVYVHDHAAGGTQYYEFYSGVMTWFATATNDAGGGAVSEIALHRAGHAGNSGMIYLRTRETTAAENNKLKLEIMCNKTYTSASNLVFKFVRLI